MTHHFSTMSWPPAVEIKLLGLGIQRVSNGYIVTKKPEPRVSETVEAVMIAKTPEELAEIILDWAQSIELTEQAKRPKDPLANADRIPGGAEP